MNGFSLQLFHGTYRNFIFHPSSIDHDGPHQQHGSKGLAGWPFFFQVWFAAVEIRRSCPLEWHWLEGFLFQRCGGSPGALPKGRYAPWKFETWHDIATCKLGRLKNELCHFSDFDSHIRLQISCLTQKKKGIIVQPLICQGRKDISWWGRLNFVEGWGCPNANPPEQWKKNCCLGYITDYTTQLFVVYESMNYKRNINADVQYHHWIWRDMCSRFAV